MYLAKSRSARQQRRARQRGLSLVEAVVTAGLISVGLLGLSASTLMVTRSAKTADMTSAATALSMRQLELVRSMPLGAAGHTPGSYSGGSYSPNGNQGGPVTVNWVVSAMNQPRPGLKTVTVTASWTDSKPHTLQVAGFVRCPNVPCLS
jgi:Tfp pilus assembly protein PilV